MAITDFKNCLFFSYQAIQKNKKELEIEIKHLIYGTITEKL